MFIGGSEVGGRLGKPRIIEEERGLEGQCVGHSPIRLGFETQDPTVADIGGVGQSGRINQVGLDVGPADRRDAGRERYAVAAALPVTHA